MPTIRKFDSMLDVLLLGTVVSHGGGDRPAVTLLRSQNKLYAYKVAKNVLYATMQAATIGTIEGRQVVFDAIRMEELPTPTWLESVNPSTGTKEGWLVEAQGEGAWAVSCYVEKESSYGTKARAFTLQRDEQGSMRVRPAQGLRANDIEVRTLGEAVLALLAIITAPMLTQIVDDRPARRGMTQFRRIRMAEPWTDIDRHGIPRLGTASHPAYVADEILDEVYILEGRVWSGLHQFETAEQRSGLLRQLHYRRRGINGAMRLVLSRLTAQAAAEVAEAERTGMDKARALVVLPDFLTWIEWRDVNCGVPGQRWGTLLQAVNDEPGQSDARGLMFALPADWKPCRESFNRMPMLTFELRLKSVALALLEVTEESSAMAAAGEVDADRLGRFLLATLTFISQPRMTEQADTKQDPARQNIDRARVARRLKPQLDIKEIRLLIDLPQELEQAAAGAGEDHVNRSAGGGVAPGGMPWHRVRMFWRWRLGRLEIVRPHSRGSVENGVSRRVILLLHPAEIAKPSRRGVAD